MFTYCLHDDNELVKNAGSTVITSSSEDSDYPDDNVTRLPLAQPWRTTGTSNQWFEVDFVTAKSADLIVVAGLNLTGSPGTFRVKSGDSTPPSDETHVLPAPKRGVSWLALGSAANRRYWRLEITDSANPDGFLDVGYLLIGTRTEFTHGFGPRFERGRVQRNRRTEDPFGVGFSGELLADLDVVTIDFGDPGALNASELAELDSFLLELNGAQKTLFFTPLGEDATSEGYVGELAGEGWTTEFLRGDTAFSRVGEISFRSQSRGLPLPSN